MRERSESSPSVFVVVVNWNGEHVLEDCLDSVLALTYPVGEVVVVDNGSSDRSLSILDARYGDTVSVLRNDRNLGAPVARNQGLRYAVDRGADFVFTLDNDLTIAPGAIEPLVRIMRQDASVVMAGALILHQDRPDVIFSAGHLVDWTQNLVKALGANETWDGQFSGCWDVDYVGSGAMLTRSTFIREHGVFEEAFIGYGYEDTEYGYRANQLGYRVVCSADARVWHRPHSGIGRYSFRKKYLEGRNAILFMKRHGTPARWAKYLFFLVGGFVYAGVREAFRGRLGGVYGKMLGVLDGFRGHEERAYRILEQAEPD